MKVSSLPSMQAITKLGLAFALFALVSLGLFVSTASAATINVPGDQPTIAAAVAAAVPGDVIEVASGTYSVGQILISKNLTISGNAVSKPVIQPALALPNDSAAGAWFLVSSGVTFNVDNVVFDGSTNFVHQALRSHGNTTVDAVDFRNIRGSLSGQPYRGVAIESFGGTVAGGAGNDSHGGGGAASHLVVTNSTFTNIGRIGVLVKGTQSTADIQCNTYTGKGNGDWLDYGFEAGAGGSITVTRNTVSGNTGVASDGSTSAGILVTTYWGPGTDALIQNNTLSNNTTGIAVGFDAADTSSVEAHNNNITGNNTGVSSTNPVVDATSNWWGDASGPGGVGPGTGDAVTADVLFGSWLTNPASGVSCGGGGALNSSFIKIEAKNSGSITNTTSSKASTGSNTAEGSRGGRGGRGGDVEASAEVENGDSHDDAKAIGNNGGALAGDGGDGGNGSFGGYVGSGTSTAMASTENTMNDTDVGMDIPVTINSTKLEVEIENKDCKCNLLDNTTRARARTGNNDAKGSDGGSGGSGGEIEADAEADGGGDAETTGNNGGAIAGNGGSGGSGALGGTVETGIADSFVTTTNRMNTTRIRIN